MKANNEEYKTLTPLEIIAEYVISYRIKNDLTVKQLSDFVGVEEDIFDKIEDTIQVDDKSLRLVQKFFNSK